jgi:hypothetical protein
MCHPSNKDFVGANNFYMSIYNVTNIRSVDNYGCIDEALVIPQFGYTFQTIPLITSNYNRNCENRAYLACYFQFRMLFRKIIPKIETNNN